MCKSGNEMEFTNFPEMFTLSQFLEFPSNNT